MSFRRETMVVPSRVAGDASVKLGLHQLLKRVGVRTAGGLGVGLSRLCGSCAGTGLGILTYHRIAPLTCGAPAPTWNVTPARFRGQLAGLLAGGYRAWPLRKVLEFSRKGAPIPRKTFVVTFDDGYESVYRHAWPILRELQVPATVFLATAYLDTDTPFPFDDWRAAGSNGVPPQAWRPLSTPQCGEMLADGLIELGSHTHTHVNFRQQPEAFHQDVLASLEVLRSRFHLNDATLAFPFGIAGPALLAAARRTGVLCGLTIEKVLVKPQSDPFPWGRFTVEDADTAAWLTAYLDGWYSLARNAWRFVGRPWSVQRATCSYRPLIPGGEATR